MKPIGTDVKAHKRKLTAHEGAEERGSQAAWSREPRKSNP
jgi:hypothetical protein